MSKLLRINLVIVISVMCLLVLSPAMLSVGAKFAASQYPVHSLTPKNAESSNVLQRYAFFPREPRLQDIQPNSGFAQVGVASYGANGTTVNAEGVQGIAVFNSASIGYYSATIINNSVASSFSGSGNASLQLNAVAFLSNDLGYFWAQDVALISQAATNTFNLQLINNIWNFNSLSSNMSPGIVSGNGSVYCFTENGAQSCFYYAFDPNVLTVTAPFSINLTMWTGKGNSSGATDVSFNYNVHDSTGQSFSGAFDDAVLYPSKSKVQSYFRIGGESPLSSVLPGGTTFALPNDLEFVIGGPGSGSGVFVNSISSTEQLSISSGTRFVPAGDTYSVGSDTGEMAAGVAVSPDLSNPSSPVAVLRSGFDSAVKLWPLPLSFGLTSTSYADSLEFSGQLIFSTENYTSAATPARGLNLAVLTMTSPSKTVFSRQIISADMRGGFAYNFKPNSGGTFALVFSYGGSPSFLPQNQTEQIAVSTIVISSLPPGTGLSAEVNSTSVQLPNLSSDNWLFAVANGTRTVSFQDISNIGNSERVLFSGFKSSPSSSQRLLPQTISLNSSVAQTIDASFVIQYNVTISNPITSSYVSKWYNQSQVIDLSAPSSVTSSGVQYMFSGWVVNGRILGSSASTQNISANSPMQITAQYSSGSASLFTEVNLMILAGIAVLGLVVGLGIGLYLRRTRNPRTG